MTKDDVVTPLCIEKDDPNCDTKKYDVNGLTECSATNKKCDIEEATGLRKVCI